MDQVIKIVEKILLIAIAIDTVFATGQEIHTLIQNQRVQLADLLLLFIYTEVLGMVVVFYKTNRIYTVIPITIRCCLTRIC